VPGRSVEVFDDDDGAFFDWLDRNPDGYFLNTSRNPTVPPTLHLGSCEHIGRLPTYRYTKLRVKVCSRDRRDLEQWSADRVGGEPTKCRSCFG